MSRSIKIPYDVFSLLHRASMPNSKCGDSIQFKFLNRPCQSKQFFCRTNLPGEIAQISRTRSPSKSEDRQRCGLIADETVNFRHLSNSERVFVKV
jgi:hypothetical protein